MQEEVKSLAARVGVDNALSLPAAQRLSKEVGLLTDVHISQHTFSDSNTSFQLHIKCITACVHVLGGREHIDSTMAEKRAAVSLKGSTEEQQHGHQEAGDQRGGKSPNVISAGIRSLKSVFFL